MSIGLPVQSASGSGSGSGLTTGKTLSGAPTAGNLLIFAVNTGNGTGSTTYTFDTTKWFIIDVATSPLASDQVITLLGRYVQIGDTATMPAFCTAGSGFFSYEGYEIPGVSGTFATDFLCSSTNQIKAAVNTISTFKQAAVANGSLGLVFYAKYNESSSGTPPAGWTSDINTVDAGNYGSFGCAHLALAAGATAQATFTSAGSGANTFGIVHVILTPSQPAYPIVKRSVSRVDGASGFPGALFFGGKPFTGDLVRAYLAWHDGSTSTPTVNTGGGWVNDTNALNGSNPIMLGLYRYAQVGDTNTLPALCTAGATFWAVTFVEIGPAAALTGTFATDHKSAKSAYQASGATLTTTSDTTTTNSSLCTTGFTEYNATAAGSNTGADQNANAVDSSDYGWWAGSQVLNPSSGASVQTVWTLNSSAHASGYIQDIWKGVPVPETGTVVMALSGISFVPVGHEYAAKTKVVLSGTTLTVPADWNNLNNSVEALGAAGNSVAGTANTNTGASGGSGGYSKQTNVVLTPGSTVTIQVGAAGVGSGAGNDTFLQDNSSTTKVLAQSGASAAGISHGNGAPTGRAVGSTIKAGQAGSNGANSTNRGGPSGASPPGPLGAGNPGLASAVASGAGAPGADNGAVGNAGTATVGGLGGVNDAGTGAGAGATSTTNAGDGVDGGGPGGGCPTATHTKGGNGTRTPTWTDTLSTTIYGPGSSGAGGGAGGDGGDGSYGAAGGGGGVSASTGGAAGASGNGLLVLKWVPAENAAATLALSGISFASSGADHTGVVRMALSGIAFSGSGHRAESATGRLALSGVSILGVGISGNIGTAAMALHGVAIAAIGFDAGHAGGGTKTFAFY